MKFEDLTMKPHPVWSGVQARCDFPNGYGASVVRAGGAGMGLCNSYGASEGLWELAVVHNGHLCYDTPITDDVIGNLTEDDVTRLLGEIEALPAKVSA